MSTPAPPIVPLGVRPGGQFGPPGNTQTPGPMTANAVKVVGFTVASLALIGLSRLAPTGAVFISVAILLGVALTHSAQITTLVTRLTGALGNSGTVA